MTGYTVHTGSNEKFSSGWDKIFTTRKATDKKAARKQPKPKSAAGKKSKKRAKR